MSNKYTSLSGAEDSSSIPETILPSYELVEITPGSAHGNDHECNAPQPLHVNFYADPKEVLMFKFNYCSHRGVDGIHQIVKKKLHSMDIDLRDELYLIGVLEGLKIRLISIDEDSFGNEIHYFKAGEALAVEDIFIKKRQELNDVKLLCVYFIIILLIVFSAKFKKHDSK